MLSNSNSAIKDEKLSLIEEDDVAYWDWDEIGRALDANLANVNDSYFFLLKVIESKKVCKEVSCPIWPQLLEITKVRAFFCYPTIAEAELHILDESLRDEFKNNFADFKFKILELFNLIIQTATTRETRIYEEDIYHQRNIDIIRELVKSNQPIPIDVAKNLSSIMQVNSNLGESSEELKKHNEELKKREDEKKKKESEKK